MEKFCLAPWHSIRIDSHGTAMPCCVYTSNKATIDDTATLVDTYSSSILNLKKMNSIDHPGCIRCKISESNNNTSRRQILSARLQDLDDNRLQFMDLNFGNLCNLKCRMCSGQNSTKWIPDEVALSEHGFPAYNRRHYRISAERLKFLINYCNTEISDEFRIDIKGGEPMLQQEVLHFLQNISAESKKKIKIRIFTNGTSLPDEYIQELTQFKKAILIFSIEAVGAMYSYIRGGPAYSITDIQCNIKKIKDTNIAWTLSVTISIYNIFSLVKLLKWIKESDLDECLFENIVTYPAYLDPSILPDQVKYDIIESIKIYPKLMPVVQHLIAQEHNPKLFSTFLKFTKILDERRNESLCAIDTNFITIFEQYK